MKFQITIRTAGTIEDSLTRLAIFLVEAPNWEAVATRAVALGSALGLEYGQYESEIVEAAKERNTILPCVLFGIKDVPKGGPSRVLNLENALPPLERAVELLLTQDRTTITDDELPTHFIQTPLDLEQRAAVKESAKYLKRVNDQATGVHRLSTREQEVSLFFSAMFAIPLYLFRDGNWICEAVDHTKTCGMGALPSDAINDFIKSNNIEAKNLPIVEVPFVK